MAEKQPEKDTLWSWIVLALVTVIVFLEIGMTKCLSVLLPDLKEQLSSRTWIIGSSISIVYGWGYALGMTSGSLLQRFGARMTFAVSGSLTCIGLIVCACATHVYHLLFGLLLVGFVYVEENIVCGMLSTYFDKYFAISVSTVLLGGDTPIIVMPPLTQLFLECYGLRGAIIILSAISFHSVLCSLIIKENMNIKDRNASKQEKTSLLSSNARTRDKQSPEGYFGFCKSIIDGSLLKSRHFVVRVLVPGFAWGYSFNGWLIYTVTYALSNGATMREAALVSTCGGIGVTLTRLVIPMLNKHIHHKYLIYASLLLASASLGLAALWVTLIGMYTSSVIFGVASSVLSASAYIAARANSSDDEYVHAVSWFHLVYGFASILAGTVSGLIYDATGSFQLSFASLAAVPLLSIVLLGLDDIWTRTTENKNVK